MPFSIRRHRRFPVQCSATYNAEPFLKLKLASCSGFWLLITLLLLSSRPAYAEWMRVEKDYLMRGLQIVYVDPNTIHREGNLVTMRQLIDFKWMQGSARGPTRFMSTETHKQFDCAEQRLRLLAFTEFSHRMGTGIQADGLVDKDNWLSIEPESINHALWEVPVASSDRAAASNLRRRQGYTMSTDRPKR